MTEGRHETDDPLERAALEWIAPYWNAEHLVRTRDWLLALEPDAGLALRLAALTHDIERHFPGGPTPDPFDPGYPRRHAERSALLVYDWLEGQRAPDDITADVIRLVAAHEVGGWPDADLLQAADSLSFLEINAARPAVWVREGRCDVEAARGRLREMHARIRWPGARAHADALLEQAVRRLEEALARVA